MAKNNPPPPKARFVPSAVLAVDMPNSKAEAFQPAPTISANLGKPTKDTVDLNFKVHPDFHATFKLEAVRRRMKMNELMHLMFDYYIQSFPSV